MLTGDQARQLLLQQSGEGRALLGQATIDEVAYRSWAANACDYIAESVSNSARHIEVFESVGVEIGGPHSPASERQNLLHQGLERQIKVLDALSFRILKDDTRMRASNPKPQSVTKPTCVFIGHGRSKLWARLKIFLEDELQVRTTFYENESRVGESIVPVLEKMLDEATFAALVLSAEDETQAGTVRARQNVVHEAGLFQGRLGFKRAILLLQRGIEEFSNVDGLQHIPFSGDQIEEAFYELQRVLKREGQVE